jgi:urease accessory protein UreF
MAKGDGKKGKKDKVRIPKRIAGVKVSKAVRKAGKTALKLAEQPAVSETVAAALLATAAALRDPPAAKRATSTAADAAGEAGQEAIRLGDSLRKLALDMARRTLDAWEAAEAKPRGDSDFKDRGG